LHRPKFLRIGLPDAFPQGYGSQKTLFTKYGLTPSRIVEEVLKLL
jgi:transketolase C-terminal domain/subunit